MTLLLKVWIAETHPEILYLNNFLTISVCISHCPIKKKKKIPFFFFLFFFLPFLDLISVCNPVLYAVVGGMLKVVNIGCWWVGQPIIVGGGGFIFLTPLYIGLF